MTQFLFQIDSFLLDDNEIESEEENLFRTSTTSPLPNIAKLSRDRGYLEEDNNDEEEEDSDDLDADLKEVSSITSSSHRRFLLTGKTLKPLISNTSKVKSVDKIK